MKVYVGSSSWIQQLNYETLPFRYCVCHEYGHLQRRCPWINQEAIAANVSSKIAPKIDNGKAPMVEGDVDLRGFVFVKPRNKGRGQKRTFKDRQNDGIFNRFDALDDLI